MLISETQLMAAGFKVEWFGAIFDFGFTPAVCLRITTPTGKVRHFARRYWGRDPIAGARYLRETLLIHAVQSVDRNGRPFLRMVRPC